MPYVKEIFNTVTFEQAKHIALTTDSKYPDKFERETNFLVDAIQNQGSVDLNDTTVVLDFGCGMGRVAKELINRFDCNVIGVDISPTMLMFAKLYVSNMKKFQGVHEFSTTESVDVALSVFALQHTEYPQKEIDNIVDVLKPGGKFILLNEKFRLVPGEVDSRNYIVWKDDGFDVIGYVNSKLKMFDKVEYVDKKLDIFFYRKEI